MLEKPDLDEAEISAYLQNQYRLSNPQATFLPLGADLNTAVYRVTATGGASYFLKLRRGHFDETCVALPKFLSDQGIGPIIAPLPTKEEHLWGAVGPFKAILYPFVEGRDAYDVDLSEQHWVEFGAALKRLHTTPVPDALSRQIRKETYSTQWREVVKRVLATFEGGTYDDPIAMELVAFLKSKRQEIAELVTRAEQLAESLQERSDDFTVCHSDLHAGNLLIGTDGTLHIVDWDEPILAPKERDLMYVGGGLMGCGRSPQEEEALFYRGYGEAERDPVALAYYRYERIVQDIAEYCQQLLSTNEGGEDREQSLHYLKANFLPGGTIAIADQADRASRRV